MIIGCIIGNNTFFYWNTLKIQEQHNQNIKDKSMGKSIAKGKRFSIQLPKYSKRWQKPRAESLEPKTEASNWHEPG